MRWFQPGWAASGSLVQRREARLRHRPGQRSGRWRRARLARVPDRCRPRQWRRAWTARRSDPGHRLGRPLSLHRW